MKTCLATPWLLACGLAASSGAAPPAPAAAPSTNTLVIVSEMRSELTATNAYWLGRVRAGDGEIYLECELLTAYFSTNSVRTNAVGTHPAAKPAAPRRAGEKEHNTRFELLVAETNVMIISGGRQIVGDHAEYFATNDFLFVTGKPVIVEDSEGMMVCDKFTHDRQTGRTEFLGQNLFIGSSSLMSRTNPPAGKPATNVPPPSK